MKLGKIVTTILLLTACASQAQAQTYQSASVDRAGQLSVTPNRGAIFRAPLLRDQVAFSQPAISKDHETLAWLAGYPDPGSAVPVAARLVLYRAGRVLRTYGTDQVIWSWQFAPNGKDVAFCTGPTHGGADRCELHRIVSGRLLAIWGAHAAGTPPAWVKDLVD